MARRNPADGAALDPALTQKKRARRRLVGALVLGVAAATVLPLVLDSEPRQTITDVEIEIPPREAALPALDAPGQSEAAAAPSTAAASDDAVVPPPAPVDPAASARSDPKADAPAKADGKPSRSEPTAQARTEAAAAPERRSSAKTEAPKVATARPQADAGASVRGESGAAKTTSTKSGASASAAGSRFALQLGAFANAGSARAQLDKARRTGLRGYTETVSTAQGDRTRVRVGPFATREEAEKARATLKLSGIDSSVVDAR